MTPLPAPDASTAPVAVSVVVPHYGSPAPASHLVAQLRVQSAVGDGPPPTLQLIVVDDHSPQPFPPTDGVEVVRRETNGGFGAAANTGAGRARHELLLVLNSDLDIGPTFVADLVAAARPWLPAVVSPAVLAGDGVTPAEIARHFISPARLALLLLAPFARWADHPAYRDLTGVQVGAVPGRTVVADWVSGAALLLPTDELRAVGGFDERYHMFCEEVDLQRRLRARGLPSVYAGDVTCVHEGAASTDPAQGPRWQWDAYRRYFGRWGGLRRYEALGSAAALVNLAWNGARRAAGTDVAPVAVARAELAQVRGWQR